MSKNEGFTIPELLFALFIGAAFVITAYQLFGLVIADGGNARAMANASNLGYLQMRQTASNPTLIGAACLYYSGNNVTTTTVTGTTIPGPVVVKTTLSCPIGTSTSQSSVTLVSVTVTYGTSNQHVTHSTYAMPR